jgi:uncharacterized membrane protein YkvI
MVAGQSLITLKRPMSDKNNNWFTIYLLPGFVFQSLVIAGGKIGLVGLIAKGYGFLTWVFILVFVIPVMTIGVVRILRSNAGTGNRNNPEC